ncbi:MAG: hypothetical protein HY645_13125 [Acidobacteria bacterium]|nr:hypothetical protein [Acidobacteriota bacterium]
MRPSSAPENHAQELHKEPQAEKRLLVIPAGTRLKVRLVEPLSTRRNQRGETFEAELSEEVHVEGATVIARGNRVGGVIAFIRRAGRISGRAEILLRFLDIEASSGTRVPLQATLLEVQVPNSKISGTGSVKAPSGKSRDAAKVGTVAGVASLIGLLGGGGRGAKAGAIVGGASGVAGVLTTRGKDLELGTESELVLRLDRDLLLH